MNRDPKWVEICPPSSKSLPGLYSLVDKVRDIGSRHQDEIFIDGTDFTIRDEANALTAFAFRNGYLETLHAGATGFSDAEMKKLMVEASDHLAQALAARDQTPELYAIFLLRFGSAFSSHWDRKMAVVELQQDFIVPCVNCGNSARADWSFCASCGVRRPATNEPKSLDAAA